MQPEAGAAAVAAEEAASAPLLPCDLLSPSSLSCLQLLQSVTRSVLCLYHHVEPQSGQEAEGEEEEDAAVDAFSLSRFLSSRPSSGRFHCFGSSPPTAAAAHRLLACLAAMRQTAEEQSRRVRAAAAAAASLERAAFFSSSLSALSSQSAAVAASLESCSSRLDVEAERQEAERAGSAAFTAVRRRLWRLRGQLRGLQQEEAGPAAAAGEAEAETATLHLASSGQSSCFVIELKLRRRERPQRQWRADWRTRCALLLQAAADARSSAASAGVLLPPPPRHDCLVLAQADFLQGESELSDAAVNADLLRLVSCGRWSRLRRCLSHLLAMEATADRLPHLALYARRAAVMDEMQRLLERRRAQPLVLSSALDGLRLSFHHVHCGDGQAAARSVPRRLLLSPAADRLRFASSPQLLFTHSLTYVGMTDSADGASLSFVLALQPAVLLPAACVQQIAKIAAPRLAAPPSRLPQPGSAQRPSAAAPSSYHDEILRALPAGCASPAGVVHLLSSVHRYRLLNEATRAEGGCVSAALTLPSLHSLQEVVQLLQQCVLFSQLYASCFCRQRADWRGREEADADIEVQLTAFPPHSLRLSIARPALSSGQQQRPPIVIDIRLQSVGCCESCSRLPSPAPAACFDCHLLTVSVDRSYDCFAPCSDAFATAVLCSALSVPAMVQAVWHKAELAD